MLLLRLRCAFVVASGRRCASSRTSRKIPVFAQINPDLKKKLTEMENRWHSGQKMLERARYIAMRNPHASRGREEKKSVEKGLNDVHAEYQRVLQRSATIGVSQTEHVFDAYCQLFRPTAWHFNVLMDSFRRHQPLQCQSIISRMDREGIAPDVTSFNIMLEAMTLRQSPLSELEIVTAQMQKRNIIADVTTRSLLLTSLAKDGSVELAESSMSEMVEAGEMPNVDALTALLSMYGKKELMEQGETIRGILLNGEHSLLARHYSEVMRYLIRRGVFADINAVWDEVDAKMFRVSDDIFSSYLHLLFQQRKADDDKDISMDSFERQRNLSFLLRRARESSVRLDLIPAMPIFLSLVRKKRTDLLGDFVQALSQATPQTRKASYEKVCALYEENGDVAAVMNVIDLMATHGLAPQTLGNEVLTYGITKKVHSVRELLEALMFKEIPVYKETLFTLMFCFSNRLDPEGCNEVAKAMGVLGITPTEHVLNSHISVFINADRAAEAMPIFIECVKRGLRTYVPNAQSLIVVALANRDVASCGHLFDMLKYGDRIPLFIEYDTYLRALSSRYPNADAERAMVILDEMKNAQHKVTYSLVNLVVSALAECERLADAEHVLEQHAGFRQLPIEGANKLIIALLKGRNIEAAERICTLVESSGAFPSILALNELIKAYGRANCIERAHAVFSVMLKRGIAECPTTYNAILVSLVRCRYFTEACTLLRDMQAKKIALSRRAFYYLLLSFTDAKHFEEGETAFELFLNSYKKGELNAFIRGMCPGYTRVHALPRLRNFVVRVAPDETTATSWALIVEEAQTASSKTT